MNKLVELPEAIEHIRERLQSAARKTDAFYGYPNEISGRFITKAISSIFTSTDALKNIGFQPLYHFETTASIRPRSNGHQTVVDINLAGQKHSRIGLEINHRKQRGVNDILTFERDFDRSGLKSTDKWDKEIQKLSDQFTHNYFKRPISEPKPEAMQFRQHVHQIFLHFANHPESAIPANLQDSMSFLKKLGNAPS